MIVCVRSGPHSFTRLAPSAWRSAGWTVMWTPSAMAFSLLTIGEKRVLDHECAGREHRIRRHQPFVNIEQDPNGTVADGMRGHAQAPLHARVHDREHLLGVPVQMTG